MIAEQSDAEEGEIEEDNEIDNDGLLEEDEDELEIESNEDLDSFHKYMEYELTCV